MPGSTSLIAAQTGLDVPTARRWPAFRSRYYNVFAGHASCHGSWRGTAELGMQERARGWLVIDPALSMHSGGQVPWLRVYPFQPLGRTLQLYFLSSASLACCPRHPLCPVTVNGCGNLNS